MKMKKFKKINIVMLETGEDIKDGCLFTTATGLLHIAKSESINDMISIYDAKRVELYFIFDEKVTDSCWVYNSNGVGFRNKLVHVDSDIAISNCDKYGWKKIIATTDKFNGYYNYPEPSLEDIKHIVHDYNTLFTGCAAHNNNIYDVKNDTITSVEVEFTYEPQSYSDMNRLVEGEAAYIDFIKVNNDNSINIKF
jgi:hypothetical protein